jgi:mono/diheme cytochrome c family protein
MRKLILALAVGGAMFGAAVSAQAQQGNPFPEGPGREIVAVACTQCHAPNAVTQLRMNEAGWRNQIYDMILRGAQIGPNDIDAATKYLATAFGPGVPFPNQPVVEVKLPDGAGKELVEGGCALCHGVDRVVATNRPKDQWEKIVNRMVFFGAPISGDQVTSIVGYLDKNYGVKQTAAK